MKNLQIALIALTMLVSLSMAQSPEGFKYQAVVRDASSNPMTDKAVGMRLTVQQGSIGGTAVYTETFAPTTNAYGLVNLEIGTGTSTDDFSAIDWSNGPYFVETAIDINGGSSYVTMGASQLMSVPYALYAKTSGNGQGPQGPAGNDGADGQDGNDGADGIDGATGAQGPQGLTGPQGPAGNDGADGVDGVDGAQGPQGIPGVQGATGPQGPAGNDGADGNDGQDGIDGAQGPAGVTGPQGPAGNDGAAGQDGLQGPVGATGPQGPAGNDGVDGAQGPQGIPGIQGATGPQGATGATGVQGLTGAQGPQGLTGAAGINGTNGIDGAQGPAGPQGPAGNVGESAYDIWIGLGNVGTETDFVNSLTPPISESFYYIDGDGDGFGAYDNVVYSSNVPPGYVLNDLDCDDAESTSNPNGVEVCDGMDNDCDGLIDEDFDQDGDGWPSCNNAMGPADCDDTDPNINPGAFDIPGNGIDENCDGYIEPAECGNGIVEFGEECDDGNFNDNDGCWDCMEFFDNDNDGFFSDVDCDDSNASVYPNAPELCDGIDNNCNSIMLEIDADGDGFVECNYDALTWAGSPQVIGGGDCDDADPNINPGAFDIPGNGIDENCDGYIEPGICGNGIVEFGEDCDDGNNLANDGCTNCMEYFDNDNDGFFSDVDCMDFDSLAYPGAAYNESDTLCMIDRDGDGWGSTEDVDGNIAGSDCDDQDLNTYPGAPEICGDAIDNDCNGQVDEGCLSIGQSYQGGIIFYLTGSFGFIVAPTDQSPAEWGCYDTSIGAYANDLTTSGELNTNAILNGCGTPAIAAEVCASLTLAGYSDWFLPSERQLMEIANNLNPLGLGNFGSGPYWSSTEESRYGAEIWIFNGFYFGGRNKDYTFKVRAIRSFVIQP